MDKPELPQVQRDGLDNIYRRRQVIEMSKEKKELLCFTCSYKLYCRRQIRGVVFEYDPEEMKCYREDKNFKKQEVSESTEPEYMTNCEHDWKPKRYQCRKCGKIESTAGEEMKRCPEDGTYLYLVGKEQDRLILKCRVCGHFEYDKDTVERATPSEPPVAHRCEHDNGYRVEGKKKHCIGCGAEVLTVDEVGEYLSKSMDEWDSLSEKEKIERILKNSSSPGTLVIPPVAQEPQSVDTEGKQLLEDITVVFHARVMAHAVTFRVMGGILHIRMALHPKRCGYSQERNTKDKEQECLNHEKV